MNNMFIDYLNGVILEEGDISGKFIRDQDLWESSCKIVVASNLKMEAIREPNRAAILILSDYYHKLLDYRFLCEQNNLRETFLFAAEFVEQIAYDFL